MKYAHTGPPRQHKGRPTTLIYPIRMQTRSGDWIDSTFWVIFPTELAAQRAMQSEDQDWNLVW